MGGRAPMDPTSTVAGLIRDALPWAARRPSVSSPRSHRCRRAPARETTQVARCGARRAAWMEAEGRPGASTTAGQMAPPWRCPASRSRSTPRRSGTSGTALSGARRRPTGPTKASPSKGARPQTRSRVEASIRMSTGVPAMPSIGRAGDADLGARENDCRAEDPDEERPEHHVARAPAPTRTHRCAPPATRCPEWLWRRRPGPRCGSVVPIDSWSRRRRRFKNCLDDVPGLPDALFAVVQEDAVGQAADGHRLHVSG